MKKIIIGLLVAVVVLILVVVLGITFFLDGAIKKGVETVGPQITKVDVKLDSASLSFFSGSGKIKGLVIGNPDGFKSPHSVSVGSASLAVSPGSIFSDKVVVKSIRVEGPEIIFEIDNKGGINLKRIQSNLTTTPPSTNTPAATEKASKKLQVDDFLITGSKVTVAATLLGGQGVTAPLPDIHFTNLGTGPEGITAAELTKRILDELTSEAIKAAEKIATKETIDSATKTVTDKATKGLQDLLNRKK